ncbi:retrovirus-related pol polyprotein from transposon TNT 1-94 [Tanacetum coccineum]
MTESPLVDLVFVVPLFSPGDDPIAYLNKAMAFLIVIASSRVTLQQVQGRQGLSYSGTGYKSNATSSRGNNASGQARVVKCYNCQDIYDSDCDDISNAKAVLMTNISNYGSDVILEVPHSKTYLNDMGNQSVHAMQDFEQILVVDFTNNEIHSDSNIIPYSQYLHETQQTNVQDTNLQAQQDSMILSVIEQMLKQMINHVNNWEKANKEQNNESKAQRIKPTLYDGIVMSAKHVAMPVIDDEETLILEEESRSKMFKKEKDLEAIRQNISHKPIEYEKLNRLSNDFGKCFTPQQELSAEQAFWLRMFNPTSKPSDASRVKIEAPKELPKVFKEQFDSIKKTRVRTKEQSDSLIDKLNLKSAKNKDLKAQIQNKVFVITSLKNDLQKLIGKEIVDIAAQTPYAHIVVPDMFKLDLEPLAPRLLQNREIHIEYLKYTQEQADILRGIVEQAKAKQPLDKELDFSCKHAQRIQELLVYVQDICPDAIKFNEKKVALTPKNKVKKGRFVEPLTSSSNIKQVESSKTSDSNTPVLPSTGLKCSTSKYGSKPTGNKKNDRISRTPCRNIKTKVKAQPRKVNKKNSVVEPICDVDVKNSLLNTNSEPICATCKKSMFDGVHDMYLLDFVENMNSHAKSAKKYKKQNIWIPTGSSKKAKIVESKNANHSKPNHTWGSNAIDIPSSSSLVLTVRFGNDNITRIMRYGDYQLGNVTISRVYYAERLGHNLFSVGQFYDADLEVAFWKNTCFIRNLEGVDLLFGSRNINFYTISLNDMLKTSLICLLSKASKTKCWLWHLHLSHLNFGTLNKLAKDGLARGIPRLKFQKDHLCSACALGKSKKSSHQPKAKDTNQEKLYLLHMDLCGPMRVARINGKSIVERRNRTLVEATRTMLIFSKASLFLWAEAINTAYYTQNRSLIRLRYNKTYKKLDLSFFHVFGVLCYPTNDNDDLGKLDAKADIGIFVGYAPAKKAFRIYNKRTQKIIETIHVTFDELIAIASEQFSSGCGLHSMTPATSSSGLVPNSVSQQPYIPPNKDDWDYLFQPMFNEYFNPLSIIVSPVQEAAALRTVVLAESPVSTSIDQDAPTISNPSTQEQEHSPIIS